MEYHYKLNSVAGAADGIVEGWIDDVLHMQYINTVIYTSGMAPLNLFRMTSSGSTNDYGTGQTRQVDNIILSTQRIGCIGGTPPPTPPAAPTNLKGCVNPPCTPIALDRWLRRMFAWLMP